MIHASLVGVRGEGWRVSRAGTAAGSPKRKRV